MKERTLFPVVFVGHVDHGKSTLVGRLLADTGSLPEGKLEEVRERCRRAGKTFEYAFLLDALKDEQNQGITIDAARCFFRGEQRDYLLIDAPGHIEFLRNMVTGASRAQAAVLVIDAAEGIRENSRRHGYLLSMLGIRQVVVAVNKMDRVGFSQTHYEAIVDGYRRFLGELGVRESHFVPLSALEGENVATRTEGVMDWYTGPTVLGHLEGFTQAGMPEGLPLRLPVQGVYKFTGNGDDRRIVAGTVLSGHLREGDELLFLPSGKSSRVASLESFPGPPPASFGPGRHAGFSLSEQVHLRRGEVAVRLTDPPCRTALRLLARIFWLGKRPFRADREYGLRLGTQKVRMELEAVRRILNADTLEVQTGEEVRRNDVGEVVLRLQRPVAFDLLPNVPDLGRFVIVDGYEICGGGLVVEGLEDALDAQRQQVMNRNQRWIPSGIAAEERAACFSQRPFLLVVSGGDSGGRRQTARHLERTLFGMGRLVYYLSIGNMLYGVDADLAGQEAAEVQREHVRRLSEVANILLDAGMILVVTAAGLEREDLRVLQNAVGIDRMGLCWLGGHEDLPREGPVMAVGQGHESLVRGVVGSMRRRGLIFHPGGADEFSGHDTMEGCV